MMMMMLMMAMVMVMMVAMTSGAPICEWDLMMASTHRPKPLNTPSPTSDSLEASSTSDSTSISYTNM